MDIRLPSPISLSADIRSINEGLRASHEFIIGDAVYPPEFHATRYDSLAAFRANRGTFESILDPRQYTGEWVEQQVSDGRYHAIKTNFSVVLVEVRLRPTGQRRLLAVMAVGDLRDIVSHIQPRFEDVARELRCDFLELETRVGWGKALPEYVVTQTRLEKRVRPAKKGKPDKEGLGATSVGVAPVGPATGAVAIGDGQ